MTKDNQLFNHHVHWWWWRIESGKATESSSVWLTFYAYKHSHARYACTRRCASCCNDEKYYWKFFVSLLHFSKHIKCISDPDQMFISCFTFPNESSPVSVLYIRCNEFIEIWIFKKCERAQEENIKPENGDDVDEEGREICHCVIENSNSHIFEWEKIKSQIVAFIFFPKWREIKEKIFQVL